jgi:hypothetical protein
MAGVPKPVLDFLLRPATMRSRQQFRYQAFYKTGKTRSATAIPLRRREGTGMAVWFMRGLQCLLCEESTWFTSKSPPTPAEWKHQQMIVETTCCARANVRMR